MKEVLNITINICDGLNIEDIAKQVKDNILNEHEHRFVDALDRTYDKVCVICGIREKQAVLQYDND